MLLSLMPGVGYFAWATQQVNMEWILCSLSKQISRYRLREAAFKYVRRDPVSEMGKQWSIIHQEG